MAKPNIVTKESLLEAANECLVEKGMQGFTLRAVAKFADVTQGTVYYHFKTKEQLLIDMATHVKEMILSDIEETEDYLNDSLELKKSAEKKVVFRYKLILMLTAMGFDYPEILEEMNAVFKAQSDDLTDSLLADWESSPIDNIDDDMWGVLVQSLIDGLAYQAVQSKTYSVKELFAAAQELLAYLGRSTEAGEKDEAEEEKESRPMFGLPKKNNLFY